MLFTAEGFVLDNNLSKKIPAKNSKCMWVHFYNLHDIMVIKWPKSWEKTLLNEMNTNLCNILETLRGTTLKRLEKLADFIYNYGAERFGTGERRRSTQTIIIKSRTQKEIEHLVRERWLRKKQWKKPLAEEKECINLLQEKIRSRLASVRRAENLGRKRRRKEQTRTCFYKDLFTKEISGSLRVSNADLEKHLERSCRDERGHETITLQSDNH